MFGCCDPIAIKNTLRAWPDLRTVPTNPNWRQKECSVDSREGELEILPLVRFEERELAQIFRTEFAEKKKSCLHLKAIKEKAREAKDLDEAVEFFKSRVLYFSVSEGKQDKLNKQVVPQEWKEKIMQFSQLSRSTHLGWTKAKRQNSQIFLLD